MATGRAATLVLLALAISSCRSVRREAADAEPFEAGSDAAADAAHTVATLEAGPADDAVPSGSSDELAARARHLLEAIGRDDSTLAADILFPREAWALAHDASDPGKDWEMRVATPFRKSVHGLWRRHKDVDSAQSVSLEIGRTMVQATIRRHGWKEPLWIVHGSHLSFVIDGRTHTLPVREMAAWRGAWYVTRLR
jgi:hypothetical protein